MVHDWIKKYRANCCHRLVFSCNLITQQNMYKCLVSCALLTTPNYQNHSRSPKVLFISTKRFCMDSITSKSEYIRIFFQNKNNCWPYWYSLLYALNLNFVCFLWYYLSTIERKWLWWRWPALHCIWYYMLLFIYQSFCRMCCAPIFD